VAVEIRAAEPDEMDEFRRVVTASLLLRPAETDGFRPGWSRCAFVDGTLATTFGAWPLTMALNGRSGRVSGVTMVSTRPAFRRRGLLRAVMGAHFAALHERGGPGLAVLHASRAAIYQRYGYGVVATDHAYEVDPRDLVLVPGQAAEGDLVELGDDDLDALQSLHLGFVADRTGPVVRAPAMWQAGPLAPPPEGGTRRVVGWRHEGALQGAVVYTAEEDPGGEGQRVAVRDLAWRTPGALRALWEHLALADLAVAVTWPRVPEDDPLPHLVLEPRRLRRRSRDGILARVVDVAAALPDRGYDVAGQLAFEVVDELCPWNAGRWVLEASPEGAVVTPARSEPDVVLPASTLALLLFGTVSATEAARMGRLDVVRPQALPAWDALLRTRHRPHCPDAF
jgi:predicted acetyltransferase